MARLLPAQTGNAAEKQPESSAFDAGHGRANETPGLGFGLTASSTQQSVSSLHLKPLRDSPGFSESQVLTKDFFNDG